MIKVIGVRFRTAGKIYFFDPVQFEVKRGDHVIVETARGVEYGTVVCDPKEVEEEKKKVHFDKKKLFCSLQIKKKYYFCHKTRRKYTNP